MEPSNLPSEETRDQPGLRPNRACRNCVQIKAKCVPCEDQPTSTCQRCDRLGKVCTTPAPVSRKRLRAKVNRVAELEQKVSDLTHLLDGRHDDVSVLLTPPVSNAQGISPSTAVNDQDTVIYLTDQEVIPWGKIPGPASVHAISPELCHPFAVASHDKFFELFRVSMSKHFPFIALPHHVPASTLSTKSPFLYTACVMTGAHRNPPLQTRIARDMLKYSSEKILLSGEKSLDLLQGLMIAVVWHHVYTYNNPQLMNLLHLAKALMIDLGINRPPGSGLYQIKMSSDAQSMLHGTGINGPKHTFEQRRIYLGVYHANSKLCACFRRMDDMRWNDYLEDCCQRLEKSPEYPSDEFAAALVRLDHLVERYMGIDGIKPSKTLPLQTYIQLFTNDVDQLVRNLSPWLREDEMMLMHLQNAELCLYEVLIGSDSEIPAHKVEALHSCLNKVTTFFNKTFLAVSAETLASIPFLVWAHVTHALDVVAKLSFLRVPGWDIEWACKNPGFISVTDKLIVKLQDTYAVEQSSHPDNISVRFKIFAAKLQWCQQWYRSKLEAEARANQGDSDNVQHEEPNVLDVESLSFNQFGEFSDMLWSDFMAHWPIRSDTELGLNFG